MKLIFLSFLLLVSSKIHAVGIGMGTYVPTTNRYQNEPDGSRDFFQLNPYFSITHYFQIFTDHFLAPELGMAFHSNTEEEYSKRTTIILWHAAWRINDRTLLRYGVGTFWTRISGDGEEVTLPNGANGSATFYAPTESATAYNSSLDIGVEFITGPNWGARADVFVLQPFDKDQRAVSYILSMVYVP